MGEDRSMDGGSAFTLEEAEGDDSGRGVIAGLVRDGGDGLFGIDLRLGKVQRWADRGGDGDIEGEHGVPEGGDVETGDGMLVQEECSDAKQRECKRGEREEVDDGFGVGPSPPSTRMSPERSRR